MATTGCHRSSTTGKSSASTITNNNNNNDSNDGGDEEEPATLSAILLSSSQTLLLVGDSSDVTALAAYSNGAFEVITDRVSWSVSDESVISLEEGEPAEVTALTVGSSQLVASFEGFDSEPHTFEVTGVPIESVALSAGASSLEVGDSLSLQATATFLDGSTAEVTEHVELTVSNSGILSVTEGANAAVTALAEGVCEVMAELDGLESEALSLTVSMPDLQELVVTADAAEMEIGGVIELTVEATFSNGFTDDVTDQVTWNNGDPAVVEITGSNPALATGLIAGESLVSASIGSETSAEVTLTVLEAALATLTLSASSTLLNLGGTADVTVTAVQSDGTSSDVTDLVTFDVSDGSVLQVAAGSPAEVTALGYGSSTLTASYNGVDSNTANFLVQDPAAIAQLVPGGGWTGPTAEPGQVGSGSGSDAKAIARWDVVPHQTFNQDFQVGVVAFHVNQIDRVEMAVDGGPWVPIYVPTVNPRTGVAEYWANLSALNHSTGTVEVRAIAYPTVGEPRLLPSMELFADPNDQAEVQVRYISQTGSDSSGDGSESNPFRTARKAGRDIQSDSSDGTADGGIIYCLAGNIVLEDGGSPVTTSERWCTIMPAPGLTKDDVNIVATNDNLETKLVRLKDVTIHSAVKSGFSNNDISSGDEVCLGWFDDCLFQGNGQTTTISSLTFVAHSRFTAYYATDCELRDDKNGLTYATMLRNCHIQSIGSDAFKNGRCIINCSVDDVHSGNTGWHADIVQYTRSQQNNILYGIHATNCKAQGIFCKPSSLNLTGTAIVNVLIEEIASLKSEWESNSSHVLLWNCSFIDHAFYFTGNGSNVSVCNNYFEKWGSTPGGAIVDNNHYRNGGSTPGTNVTTGGSIAGLFLDAANDDFRPDPNEDLYGPNRPSLINEPLTPCDAAGAPWLTPASVGGLENSPSS